jgi:hypothetical protein
MIPRGFCKVDKIDTYFCAHPFCISYFALCIFHSVPSPPDFCLPSSDFLAFRPSSYISSSCLSWPVVDQSSPHSSLPDAINAHYRNGVPLCKQNFRPEKRAPRKAPPAKTSPSAFHSPARARPMGVPASDCGPPKTRLGGGRADPPCRASAQSRRWSITPASFTLSRSHTARPRTFRRSSQQTSITVPLPMRRSLDGVE